MLPLHSDIKINVWPTAQRSRILKLGLRGQNSILCQHILSSTQTRLHDNLINSHVRYKCVVFSRINTVFLQQYTETSTETYNTSNRKLHHFATTAIKLRCLK